MTTESQSQSAAAHPAGTRPFPGLIIREKSPENLEFPFSALRESIVPNEHFFIRNHFPVPQVVESNWKLTVEGHVERPFELSYAEICELASEEVTMTLECAGNSRIFLEPKVAGLQWEQGAVGNAIWKGVPLAAILERAGIRKGAVEVVLEGADNGEITKEPKSPGKIHFARSLPLPKAISREVILAHTMNGERLPPAHGFPIRAIVPGWYAMASVKWLRRIVVTDKPFRGYFQTSDYTYWERREELPIQLLPVGEMEVKAEIARPASREVIPADSFYKIRGAAWAGEFEVTGVEISMDGGDTWEPANVHGKPEPYAWRLWDYNWKTPATPGSQILMARATDAAGNIQPMDRDSHRGTYIVSQVQPIEVEIRAMTKKSPEDHYAI